MTPNITHIAEPAIGAYFAGADAISAINTIKSITMSPLAEVNQKKTVSGYSGKAVKPIALRHILEMSSHQIMKRLHTVQFSGIVGSKCVGCHLCRLVCPTGAIGVTRRVRKK